ncbi:MAG: glycosyltransferase family 1 protein [Proteiniphilum sp.]|jgi:glycosyltransferase involved in cell wall biosynthesis|uniref:glycosyltransferase family 4 protein n=1 Tax=Proteiniphilum sp. TaxID=1926877 RepID=UPI002B20BE47|nr:glycosyltransferase family 1 protein [Proteiniphilum sp.]MEA5129006.1 glycosyltransferase family 1 protein [Proteiniphilum sp.]
MQVKSIQKNQPEVIKKKSKIKVAFFSDILVRDFDGANKTMFQLIDRIPESEYNYLFFCGMSSKNKMRHLIREIPTMTIPYNHTYKLALPHFRKAELITVLSMFQPDVIHIATPSSLGFFALNYAKKQGIPVLSIYHTHFISYIKYYLKNLPFLINFTEAVIARTYRKFYNKCDLTYIPTHQIAKELEAHGVSPQNFKLWQRGINTSLFSPDKRDRAFIKRLTHNDYPSILFASRLVWEKNLETLFAIYDRVQVLGLKVNFLVAGNGVAEEDARTRMKDAFFFGFLPHETLAKVYASSDIFLFTSVSESYGNVVIEAMASGCVPVIARGGGSQALVDDGITGFLCNPDEPDDYIEKIKKLLDNYPLRKKMQFEGLEFTSTLDWESLAKVYFNDIKYLAHYSESLQKVAAI